MSWIRVVNGLWARGGSQVAATLFRREMIRYDGPLEDASALIQFFRREAAGLRNLRKVVIDRERAVVLDVNGDGIEFPGLTYGAAALEELLRELGVAFTPATLHDAGATPGGVKEYRLSARWTWGHDRVM